MLLLSVLIKYHYQVMFSTSYFESSLSTLSIKRVNATPLWDFLASDFGVVLKIIIIAELFIVL